LIICMQNPCVNTVKVQLQKAETVSRAIELCRAARVAGWSVIVGAAESNGQEVNDTFLADFAG
jgi:enolase